MKNRGNLDYKWLIAFAVIFLLLALVVMFTSLSTLETGFFRFVNNFPDWLYIPLFIIMQAGSYFSVITFSVFSLLLKKKTFAMEILFAGSLAWILAEFFKIVVSRERPFEIVSQVVLRVPNSFSFGFPSGHTAVAMSLATTASFYFKGNIIYVVWFVAALVAIARIYVGVHLPLDVIGGIVLGLFAGNLTRTVLKRAKS